MSEHGPRRFAVYAVIANRPHNHDLRFLGEIEADDEGEQFEFHKAVDGLLERVTADMPRDAGLPHATAWEVGGWEAVVCWPKDSFVQVDTPTRRPMVIGYGSPKVRDTRRFRL